MISRILERFYNIDPQEMMTEEQRNVLNYCTEIVQEVAKDGGWIPCSERLPECEYGAETKALLFQMAETNTIYCGYYGEGGKYRDKYFRTYTNATDGFDAKEVIAWQPLPAPYQKGE